MGGDLRYQDAGTGGGWARRSLSGVNRVGRRLGWGVADQAVSSLSNFAVNIYIARQLGAEQYGAFSLVYVTYAFALNASRGLVSDPQMVRFSHTDRSTWRRVTANCTGAAVVVGLVTGACALIAAAVMGGTLGLGFLALGLTLPGLMLQDSWRFAFFSQGRGSQAFLNDLLWLVLLVPALVLLRVTHLANIFWCLLAWGAAAAAAAAFGPWQARVRPRVSGAWGWLVGQRDLGFRYMAEGTTNSASSQLRTYGIGLLLGLAPVGYIQVANTLMAAFLVLVMGTGLILMPEATRIWRDSPQRLVRFCVKISIGYTAMASAWGVLLLVTLPLGLGEWLLGPIWRPSYPLVLPATLVVVGTCAGAGAGTGLKGMGAVRRSLRAAVITAVLYVVGSLAGAAAGGAVGAMLGTAAATCCGAGIYWQQLRAGLRESGRRAPPVATPDHRESLEHRA